MLAYPDLENHCTQNGLTVTHSHLIQVFPTKILNMSAYLNFSPFCIICPINEWSLNGTMVYVNSLPHHAPSNTTKGHDIRQWLSITSVWNELTIDMVMYKYLVLHNVDVNFSIP